MLKQINIVIKISAIQTIKVKFRINKNLSLFQYVQMIKDYQ